MRFVRVCLPLLALPLLVLPLLGSAGAEDELPKLEKHPLADAKPGEYLLYREKSERWTRYFCERVLDVKDGKVLWELSATDESGKDTGVPMQSKWRKVSVLKPNRYQTVTKDKMVELDVDGKKLVCRHFVVEEPKDRNWPDGDKTSKDVWYSNDIPCSGKVKQEPGGRLVVKWGEMSADEVKQRLDAKAKREKEAEERRGNG